MGIKSAGGLVGSWKGSDHGASGVPLVQQRFIMGSVGYPAEPCSCCLIFSLHFSSSVREIGGLFAGCCFTKHFGPSWDLDKGCHVSEFGLYFFCLCLKLPAVGPVLRDWEDDS